MRRAFCCDAAIRFPHRSVETFGGGDVGGPASIAAALHWSGWLVEQRVLAEVREMDCKSVCGAGVETATQDNATALSGQPRPAQDRATHVGRLYRPLRRLLIAVISVPAGQRIMSSPITHSDAVRYTTADESSLKPDAAWPRGRTGGPLQFDRVKASRYCSSSTA